MVAKGSSHGHRIDLSSYFKVLVPLAGTYAIPSAPHDNFNVKTLANVLNAQLSDGAGDEKSGGGGVSPGGRRLSSGGAPPSPGGPRTSITSPTAPAPATPHTPHTPAAAAAGTSVASPQTPHSPGGVKSPSAALGVPASPTALVAPPPMSRANRGRASSFCHDVTSKQKKFIKDEEVAAEVRRTRFHADFALTPSPHTHIQSAKALQDDNSHVTWVMFAYVPGTVLAVERVGQGMGGLDELTHTLKSNPSASNSWVRFIFVKVVVDFSPKVVMITWCGTTSKLNEKARSSMDRMIVKEWMNAYCTVSAEYPATTVDELSST